MSKKSTRFSPSPQLKAMLKADFRRMFTTTLFYIMVGISLVIPILILVMTTMMDGTESINPQTGEITIMHGFENAWQIIGSNSNSSETMSMDITSMCNINMMFFGIAVFVCIFIADEFRSGYAKNLFTTHANKAPFVASKTIIGFVAGAAMLLAFAVGGIIGGKISGLSFALNGVNAFNIIMCILSKILLCGIFVSIFVLASVVSKNRLWMSILLSLGIGMLMFTMVPIITPLNSSIINLVLCFVGSIIFSFGIGVASKKILDKTSLI